MATRLPSGRYRTQIFVGYENGKRKYKSFVEDTAKKADLEALKWQAEHPSASVGVTLQSAVNTYITKKSAVLSPSTLRSYGAMSRKLSSFPASKKKLDMISADDLQVIVNEMSRTSSPKTVRNYYGLLGAVFKANGLSIPFAACLNG